ncbi:DNA-directed RNA polymerase [Aeromonas phage MJG]|uniref:DNA-directed RNA polymerase n=1 Tax=Aeromonas phage MJG TaxID=2510451 RepID=A0A5J6A1X9_9CAUD|nr:DNA-directed RNA polymerase [Aeromonas phage MJG]
MKDLMQVQIDLEEKMHGAGMARFLSNQERHVDAGVASDTEWYRRLTRNFVKPMSDGITAYLEYYQGRRGKPSASLTYLRCLPVEAAAYITIKKIFDSLTRTDVSAQRVAKAIGQAIEDEVRFTKLDDVAPKYMAAIKASIKRNATKDSTHIRDVMVHAEKLLSERSQEEENPVERFPSWPDNDIFCLGSKLIEIFAQNMLMNGEPVIQKRLLQVSATERMTILEPTEALEKWIEEFKIVVGNMSPAYAPCVVKPLDWTGPRFGGYHLEKVRRNLPMVKTRSHKTLNRLTRKQMPKVYQALNALQSVEWEINKDILAVANEARVRKLPYGMPEAEPFKKTPAPVPDHFAHLRGAELMAVLEPQQQEDFMAWKRETAEKYDAERERKAQYRETAATLDAAIQYSAFDKLFFVYTCDFRGRVYCQSSLVSPQGGDLQKALIRFHNPMPLGEHGEYWFKVQGANVWGWDKDEFDDRVAKVSEEEFKEMCLDIATDPLTFTEWTNADKPWQFLSWCIEYARLIEWEESGKPVSDFLSKVAVAMDGSCSGIQHYSAMLRDAIGGAEVNLLPSERPQDIYRAVSVIVKRWMEDILAGDIPCSSLERMFDNDKNLITPESVKFLCEEWLRIGVTRSMTKKPVMTLPYGSSQMTCRESMAGYLAELQAKENAHARAQRRNPSPIHNFTNDKTCTGKMVAELFASGLTWEAIGKVVVAARAAMQFIKKVTGEVGKRNQGLVWETPTGFIVEQCIFDTTERRVKTQMMGETFFTIKTPTKEINVNRMKSSAAPNFVHSMDASHLVLAVCAFNDNGINSIAVIHDSFGTHAGNTEMLRRLLIDSFVDMYQEHDVIADFYDMQCERLVEDLGIELPAKGTLDLELVRTSKYIFA